MEGLALLLAGAIELSGGGSGNVGEDHGAGEVGEGGVGGPLGQVGRGEEVENVSGFTGDGELELAHSQRHGGAQAEGGGGVLERTRKVALLLVTAPNALETTTE